MEQISIPLINSFPRWPQGIIVNKSIIIVSWICAHVQEKILCTQTYITILHHMRAVGRVLISRPLFHLQNV